MLGRPPSSEMERWKEQDLTDIVDEMFEQNEVFEQLTSFAEWLLTRVEDFNLTYNDYHLDSLNMNFTFVGEEAPRLMSYVATQDTPWTDIVTADYTPRTIFVGYLAF